MLEKQLIKAGGDRMAARRRKSDKLIFAHRQLDIIAGIINDLNATGESSLILNAKDGLILHISYKVGNVNVKDGA